ncbi:MAG TPA: hypothetical protein PLX84_11745 [Acidiphilium sp.]|nr:hypothetical protein [Acidiphilium sp.]
MATDLISTQIYPHFCPSYQIEDQMELAILGSPTTIYYATPWPIRSRIARRQNIFGWGIDGRTGYGLNFSRFLQSIAFLRRGATLAHPHGAYRNLGCKFASIRTPG